MGPDNIDGKQASPGHSESEVKEDFFKIHWLREAGGHLIKSLYSTDGKFEALRERAT